MESPERQRRHKRAMTQLKSHVDERIASAAEERGQLLVFTGNGKGKTTAAWGTLTRAMGYGYPCGVVQFIKGTWPCGERDALTRLPGLTVHTMSTGFTWETQNRETDRLAAEATWLQAEALLSDPACYLVVLDELTYMLKFGYLDIARVEAALAARPQEQSVIITGRNAHQRLIDMADTVTEMTEIRHGFNHGLKARKGLDY